MALLKQTKHIPFTRGLDDKVDPRMAPEGSVESLENCVFTKQGRIDVPPTLKEISDVINDGSIKSVSVLDEDQMFVFSNNGAFVKFDDNNFEKISDRNFFTSESEFLSREEQPIHNANLAEDDKYIFSAYQVRPIPSSSVRYSMISKDTGKLISRGEIFQARDPIPFLLPVPGILYKDLNGVLKYTFLSDINRSVNLSVSGNIRLTDDDTTDVLRLNERLFAWVTRYFRDGANRIDVHVFPFGSRYPVISRSVVISSLGSEVDVGRVFANLTSYTTNTVRICTTLNIGSQSPTIEVYDFDFAERTLEFAFSAEVDNHLSDEVISCFANVNNQLIYGTNRDNIRTGKNTLLYDSFGLIDYFILNGREYYLMANRANFVILDGNFKFIMKTNSNHLNAYRDIKRSKVVVSRNDGSAILCAPRAATGEGRVIETGGRIVNEIGYALYYNRLRLDRDQDREVEKIGNYYLISGSPLRFFDRREVVEYGFVKSPTLRVDSPFEV